MGKTRHPHIWTEVDPKYLKFTLIQTELKNYSKHCVLSHRGKRWLWNNERKCLRKKKNNNKKKSLGNKVEEDLNDLNMTPFNHFFRSGNTASNSTDTEIFHSGESGGQTNSTGFLDVQYDLPVWHSTCWWEVAPTEHKWHAVFIWHTAVAYQQSEVACSVGTAICHVPVVHKWWTVDKCDKPVQLQQHTSSQQWHI